MPVRTTGSISIGLIAFSGPAASYRPASCCSWFMVSSLGPDWKCSCAALRPRRTTWWMKASWTPDMMRELGVVGSKGGERGERRECVGRGKV